MIVEWDVPIETDDGVVLRATSSGPTPSAAIRLVLTYGPYAKGLSFQEGYPSAWTKMAAEHPDGAGGLVQPLPGVGGRRPGEVGPRRLCLRTGGLPRRRGLPGRDRLLLAAGDA